MKLSGGVDFGILEMSPLAWGRGLKQYLKGGARCMRPVAPRVGAWIETQSHQSGAGLRESPLAWGRGLKHKLRVTKFVCQCRPSRGGVD